MTESKGDSGGPLWQYYMGRAVIIGVASQVLVNVNECEGYAEIVYPPGSTQTVNLSISKFTRVSKHIDWIISVTQLH